MKIREFIEKMEAIEQEYGNIEVYTGDGCPIMVKTAVINLDKEFFLDEEKGEEQWQE